MADALISIRGDLSDITEKFAQLRGQMQALDREAAAPAAAAISERFKSIGAAIAGVGAAMTAIGGAVGAFGFEAAKGAGKTAESLELLRQKTGLTTDQLRQLTPLFNRFNTDLGALVTPFRVLSKNFEEAAAGSEKAQEKFKALGIEISATDKPIDVLGKVADAAARLGPGFERNTNMAALMGRGIATLVPILAEGSQGMARSAEDAQRMGLMLGKVTEEQLKQMDDAFDDVGTSMKAFHDTIGTAFAPVLLQLAQALTSVLGAFNLWFQGLDEGTKKMAVVFVGVFALGGPILIAVGGFMAALTLITAPMLVAGAIVVGVVAALALIVVYWQNLKSLGTTLWTGLTVTIVGAARGIYEGLLEWLVNKATAIATQVRGIAESIAKPFEWLKDHLVGHSVIPDMVDDIGRHMALLDLRMGSPARIATANTLKTFEGFKLSVDQIMGQIASVAVSVWGQITNTIAGALAQNIQHGHNWAQTWKSIQNTLLTSFINLGLQLVTQQAITVAKMIADWFVVASAHSVANATMAASDVAAATVATTVWSGAATAILGYFGTIAGGFTAIAAGLVAAVTAVGTFIMGVLSAIAEALADTIFGIPVAVAVIAGVIAIGVALAATDNLPKFGDGGMVFGPTLALVGEKGPELITPLDKIGGLNGGGGRQTINVYLDSDVIIRAVSRGMPAYLELRGVRAA